MDDKRKQNDGATLSRFESVLEIYGAQPSRWPDEERDCLLRFASDNREASKLYAEAQALERVLDQSVSQSDTSALQAKILSRISEQKNADNVIVLNNNKPAPKWSVRDLTSGLALLAASLVIGVYIGAMSGYYHVEQSDSSSIVSLFAEGVEDENWISVGNVL